MNEEINNIFQTESTNLFGEKFLYGVNGRTFEHIDSKTIYEKKYPKNFIEETSLYIINGTDSGLFIEYISQLNIPTSTKIIFIELENIIKWINENKNIKNVKNEISITTIDKLEEEFKKFPIENYIYLNSIKYIQSFSTIDTDIDPYNTIKIHINKTLESLHWKHTAELNNKLFIDNQIKNIQENFTHATELYNKFAGQSALLLAGGPSLDDAIPWIKTHRESFTLLAVSRISKRLDHANITPDIIFSIDPQYLSFDLSREMFKFSETSLFINGYHVTHPLLAQWPGRCAYLGPLLPWKSPLNITEQHPSGCTVTNVAMETAIHMGFSEIVLCGVDLCFSQEGVSHASYSKNDDTGPLIEGGDTTVETNCGGLAETTFAYQMAADQLSSLAINVSPKECRIINTNKNAAKMQGITYKPLQEIKYEKKRRIERDLLQNFGRDNNVAEKEDFLKKSLKEINETIFKLENIVKLCNKALKENTSLKKRTGQHLKYKSITKINKIEEELNTDKYRNITMLVKKFGIRNFLRILTPFNLDSSDKNNRSFTDIQKGFHDYYIAYRDAAKSLLEIFNKSYDRIQGRLEELKPSPNFELLINICKKDAIPGRVYIWEKNCKKQSINFPDNKINRFLELKNDFRDILLGNTPYDSKFNNKWGEWNEERQKKVRKKIFSSFADKETEKLSLTANNLDKINRKETLPLSCLAHGLLNELNGNIEDSLGWYNNLIDQGESVDTLYLEDALKRITSISITLHDFENGTLALQCLYDLSISYAPKYARILNLTGKTSLALDVYAEYLAKVPKDIETMLQLGNAYKKLKLPEGMIFAANHVLELSPQNKTALELKKEAATIK